MSHVLFQDLMNLSNKNPTQIGDHNTNAQSQSQGVRFGGSVWLGVEA